MRLDQARPRAGSVSSCAPLGLARRWSARRPSFARSLAVRIDARSPTRMSRPLLALYQRDADTGGFEKGVEAALQALLVSPEFLYRVELDPTGMPPNELPDFGSRARLPALFLFMEQHS